MSFSGPTLAGFTKRAAEVLLDSITINVAGRPPPKSEAKSIFAEGGKYEARLLALLQAARDEMTRLGFDGFGSSKLLMDVEIHTGASEPWDATNYLGGISDVLESKAKRRVAQPGSVDHLDHVDVGLYDDDRQIKQINYREVDAPEPEYFVTLSLLP